MTGQANRLPQPRATLKDVAAVAGTTPMTVSNVVNGRAGQAGAVVAERVLAACTALGYRPHANARRLRTNKRQAIGLVIVDPSPTYISDPLTAAMLAGLNARLGREGYSTVLHGVPPAAIESVTLLREIESDGLCLILSGRPADRRRIINRMRDLGQPLVLLQDELPDEVEDGASLLQDDQGGARAVADHLFGRSSRHAVMLAPTVEWPAMIRREKGIRAVIALLPDPPEFHVVRCGNEGFLATQGALEAHVTHHGTPDVLIGGNDQMAIAGMKLLQHRGLRVPEDLRVSGFNGLEFWRYATPELTTVFSPAYELGEGAGEAMLARLGGGLFPFRTRVMPVRFSAHGSSAPIGEGRSPSESQAGLASTRKGHQK